MHHGKSQVNMNGGEGYSHYAHSGYHACRHSGLVHRCALVWQFRGNVVGVRINRQFCLSWGGVVRVLVLTKCFFAVLGKSWFLITNASCMLAGRRLWSLFLVLLIICCSSCVLSKLWSFCLPGLTDVTVVQIT